MEFSRPSTGVGCHFLLQGIFRTQGSNPDLPHCRQLLSCLNHQGSSNPNPNSNLKGRSDQATSSKSKPFRASLELSPHGPVSMPSPGSLHSPTLSHHRAWVRVVSAGSVPHLDTPGLQCLSTGSAVPDPQTSTPLQARLRHAQVTPRPLSVPPTGLEIHGSRDCFCVCSPASTSAR